MAQRYCAWLWCVILAVEYIRWPNFLTFFHLVHSKVIVVGVYVLVRACACACADPFITPEGNIVSMHVFHLVQSLTAITYQAIS